MHADVALDRIAEGSRLHRLAAALEGLGTSIDRRSAAAALARARLRWQDVAPYAVPSERTYARRRIVRTDAFELLVLTWAPGQKSTPHDHVGSLCAFTVVRGRVTEVRFERGADGAVGPIDRGEICAGEIVVDRSDDIHALEIPGHAAETVVSVHVYSPPLPELRRYVPRAVGARPAPVFERAAAPGAPTVAIVGGGFSGTLVAAQLLERASACGRPLHVVLCERHSAVGEGPAYRTVSAGHLLNVPASNMSAWPDRPDDFVRWARARDATIAPGDFLPRKLYGEYVRASLATVAGRAAEGLSVELRAAEARSIHARAGGGFTVEASAGARIDASAVVLATGHRRPDDPLAGRWHGPRARYVVDPWSSLALSAIRADEPVVLVGSGLTAVDVVLTLAEGGRSAPIVAVSRRGLLPAAHDPGAGAPIDPGPWLLPILEGAPTARSLSRALRVAIARAASEGRGWRPVIDGLRPYIARIWGALPTRERARFLRHLRPYWEIARHRMAPEVGARVRELEDEGLLRVVSARIGDARADAAGVELELRHRGGATRERVRAAWVINCTGPGGGARCAPDPVIASLLASGDLEADELGLGVLTGTAGRARARGRERGDLLVVGTLRKPELWESTAVPELRVQAADAAQAILDALSV